VKWTPCTKKGDPVKMTVLSVLLALFLPFLSTAEAIPDGIHFEMARVIATENTVAIGMTIRAQSVRAKIHSVTVSIYPVTGGSEGIRAEMRWEWPAGFILEPGETRYFWAQTLWPDFPEDFEQRANFVVGWSPVEDDVSAPVKPPTMTRSERRG